VGDFILLYLFFSPILIRRLPFASEIEFIENVLQYNAWVTGHMGFNPLLQKDQSSCGNLLLYPITQYRTRHIVAIPQIFECE
jgi:hypothetical protein